MRTFISYTKKDHKNDAVYTRNVRFSNIEDYNEALSLANDVSLPGQEPLVEGNKFYPTLTPTRMIAGTFSLNLKKGKNTSFSYESNTKTQ